MTSPTPAASGPTPTAATAPASAPAPTTSAPPPPATPANPAYATAEQIQALFQQQRLAQPRVKRATADERVEKLRRLRTAIADRKAAIQDAIYKDFRKPEFEVDFTEIVSVLEEIDFAMVRLKKWMKPRRVWSPLDLFGTQSIITYEPLGVVLVIGPWNYPFALTMSPLVAAIAAGNCVLVKPSELTGATSAIIAEIVAAVFPPDEVTVIQGDIPVSTAALALPVDHIFFTGSIPVGRIVMAAAAKTLASVTLELGGKSPTIIDETADIEVAAQRVMWAKFINAGQTCVAPDYVWVHESRKSEFIQASKRTLDQFFGASEEKRKSTPDLARIINDKNFTRVAGMIDGSVAQGAVVEVGGGRDEVDRYIAPTLLSGVTWDMPVMSDEIFGPVLPIMTYKNIADVTTKLGGINKPLALYIFSRDKSRAWDIIRNTTSGGAVINNAVIHAGTSYLPFGGVGASGQGNYHGEHGFRTLSHERSVLVQGPFKLLRHSFPPYGAAKQTMVDMIVRLFSWI